MEPRTRSLRQALAKHSPPATGIMVGMFFDTATQSHSLRPQPRSEVLAALLAVACLLAAPVRAQDPVPPDTVAPAPPDPVAPADTAQLPDGPLHSPTGAFFRSLVLPGWGQAWVGSPGRGGVYFALSSGSVWMLYKSQQKLRQAEDEEEWLRRIGRLAEDEESGLVESRSRQVEDWLALSIFLAFFAGADAFVSAYLEDFDERVGIGQDPGGGLRIEATIPIGGRP